nr:putative glycoprotein precursor [Emaravirus sp.]
MNLSIMLLAIFYFITVISTMAEMLDMSPSEIIISEYGMDKKPVMKKIKHIKNGVEKEKPSCDCEPKIFKIRESHIVCFEGCMVAPVNTMKYHEECVWMKRITKVHCNGQFYYVSEPDFENTSNHSWTVIYSSFKKVFFTFLFGLSALFMKFPMMVLIHYINEMVMRILPSKFKNVCVKCNSSYLYLHTMCPPPTFYKKPNYNLVFYILTILGAFITHTYALPSQYKGNDLDNTNFDVPKQDFYNRMNTYRHGESTEFMINTKEHFQQEFIVNKYKYDVVVTKSYLEYTLTKLSEKMKPIEPKITNRTWSCEGISQCEILFKNEYESNPHFSIKKVNDGFSCFKTTASICGTCKSKFISLGTHYRITGVKPHIEIMISDGNSTDKILIDEFGSYKFGKYFIKPIEQIQAEYTDILVTGSSVYTGKICRKPAYGCWGPHMRVNPSTDVIGVIDPVIVDPLTHDREIIIESCHLDKVSDIGSLIETDMVYNDYNGVYQQFSFGSLSLSMDVDAELTGDYCKTMLNIKDMIIDGCYDCILGFSAKIMFEPQNQCSTLICSYEHIEKEFYLKPNTEYYTINLYYDKPEISIVCNNQNFKGKLREYKYTNKYSSHSNVPSSDNDSFSFNSIIDLFRFSIKKIFVLMLIMFLTSYILYRIFIDTFRHSSHYIMIKRRKKDDDYQMVSKEIYD